jgi:hypothetical protein
MNATSVSLTERVVFFTGPYLTRRVAQLAWESSASVCLSSAASHVLCGLSGRVSLAAHVDEQRRRKAEARVSCSLPSFLWTSIRKNGRLEAKRSIAYLRKCWLILRSIIRINLHIIIRKVACPNRSICIATIKHYPHQNITFLHHRCALLFNISRCPPAFFSHQDIAKV